MKIATRLMTLCAAGCVALVGAGSVGVYGVRGIQERFQIMTTRTAPLGSALLELQEGKERAFGSLLAMSHAADIAEANLIKTEVEQELGSLSQIAARINRLAPAGSVDVQQFQDAYRSITDRVDQRFQSTDKFKTAALKATDTLMEMNAVTNKVNLGVQKLATDSSSVARQAQVTTYKLLDLEHSAQGIKGLMADMTILVYATDALSNKYRAGPVRERWEAVYGSMSRVAGTETAATRLAKALPDLHSLNAGFADTSTGLLRLRLDVIAEVPGARSVYKKARKVLMADVTDSTRALSDLIGALKLELVIERQAIEQALAMSGDPASITSINQRLILGIKDVRAELATLMLAGQPEHLADASVQLQSRLSGLAALSATLATDLKPLGVKALSSSATELAESLVRVKELVGAVAQGKRKTLDSEYQLGESLQGLKEIAGMQRVQGRAQLSEIAALQQDATDNVDERVNTAILLISVISLLGLVGSVLFSYFSGRVIVNRLRSAVQIAEAVSSGRLEEVAPDNQNDEISSLLASLGRMVSMLDTSVRLIRSASVSVNEGTDEISRGNTALSQRTNQQARFLHETAATSEYISEIVRESAQAAEQASTLTTEASDVANRSRQVINEAIKTMLDIESGALEISNIISVIDGIAFQTNILALNAAVEAARAGATGRGFAVVASEVGQLAQQSKDSAHRIKDIIGKNVSQVESGSELVRNAGKHMEEVFDKITNVAGLIRDVSQTGTRQVESISSIHMAINNLDDMTRDNLALSQQTSLSASYMLEQARSMDAAVSVFQLSANEPCYQVQSRPGRP